MPLVGMLAILPAAAQMHPQEPDPLAKIRAAADGQACSTAETSACAQANPKILAAAMGASPLEKNLHDLLEISPRITGTPNMDRAVAWAVAAFRDAGLEAHVEKYPAPEGGPPKENVVAEIRGREEPDEAVVLGGPFGSPEPGSNSLDGNACNATLIIEAARDIRASGLVPRRSIRFVLLSGMQSDPAGSWAFVEAHRAELDHVLAAVIVDSAGWPLMSGFSLGGREELEPAVRESLDFAPIKDWDITHDSPTFLSRGDSIDFVLEGVPTFTALYNRPLQGREIISPETLRRNTAIAGVLVFALAEHATPPGPRLSHDEIAALLTRNGLDQEMKSAGVWDDWVSGKRGRQP
jgi:hypothetical protein